MRFSVPVKKHWLGSFSIVLPPSGLRGFVPVVRDCWEQGPPAAGGRGPGEGGGGVWGPGTREHIYIYISLSRSLSLSLSLSPSLSLSISLSLLPYILVSLKETPKQPASRNPHGTFSIATQTPGRFQKVDPLMGVPIKYP